MRILVVEDHRDLAETIGDYLESRGHRIDYAMDGLVGLHLAVTETYDALVLDVMLPGLDGLALCEKLRAAERDVPVLMLTARDTLPDKLAGFQAGSDDYLVKPFALPELEARLLALMRRGRGEARTLRVDDLELDTGTLQVRRAGQPVNLNRTSLRLLEALLKSSPRVVPRADLEHALWGDDPPHSDALRSHVYSLRKLIDRPFDQPLLHTVPGIGYRLAKDD
ncbi:MAG: response regulator transcription factor [Acidobacteriota bacterium]